MSVEEEFAARYSELVKLGQELGIDVWWMRRTHATHATSWRIAGLPDRHHNLDIRLVMDTDAATVVNAVEEAASRAGITLLRVPQPDIEEDVS